MKSQKDLSFVGPLVVSCLTFLRAGLTSKVFLMPSTQKTLLPDRAQPFLLSLNNEADVQSAIAFKHCISSVKLLPTIYSLEVLVFSLPSTQSPSQEQFRLNDTLTLASVLQP